MPGMAGAHGRLLRKEFARSRYESEVRLQTRYTCSAFGMIGAEPVLPAAGLA